MATAILSTVTKAFRVIELFRERDEVSLSECARLLGMPRASAHRMLVTLESTGTLERTDAGRFQLSMRMFEIGALAPRRRRLHDASCRALECLVDHFGLPSHLVVRDGHEVLCLVSAQRQAHDRSRIRAGSRRPVHASAEGKVLLAHAGEEVVGELVSAGLRRVTKFTVVLGSVLEVELERARDEGHGWEHDQVQLGCASVAVPVRDPDGQVIAALSMAGPSREVTDYRRAIAAALARASLAVTANLERDRALLAVPA